MDSQGWRRLATGTASVIVALVLARQAVTLPADGPPAPEFTTRDAKRWIGAPQRMSELRGRVVLLDVWTFG